ncbi:hypothetical protein Pint_12139 [Pistacia integerrima]|uniref:Uncharacterized protein n=1 Tax=Pistacia integerrima TaxID=434235 RepID=A0ACC0XI76_9ROSI|nr:hypothetical protein Pint_12139 [Pistacia integerrima]
MSEFLQKNKAGTQLKNPGPGPRHSWPVSFKSCKLKPDFTVSLASFSLPPRRKTVTHICREEDRTPGSLIVVVDSA